MVTRRSRLDEFVTGHHPTAYLPVQLLREDHVGTYVIPFLPVHGGGVGEHGNRRGDSGGCSRMAGVSAKPRRVTHNAAAGQSPKRDENR